jgi:hypothetical protein
MEEFHKKKQKSKKQTNKNIILRYYNIAPFLNGLEGRDPVLWL